MAGYERQVKKHLKINGWSFKRQASGSHEIWTNESSESDTRRSVTVPAKIKKRHTANAILKQANIDAKL